jgi:hypothetical protein
VECKKFYRAGSVMTVANRILVGKPEGRSRRRWVDNIGMYLREIEWGGMDWIYLAQNRDQ